MASMAWLAYSRWVLLICSIAFWFLPAAAGPRLRVQRWSVEQGMSQASVNTLLQDRTGLMWIGTHDGLNRFDGYTFTAYRADPFSPASLTHSNITALAEAADGNLWVGTLRGLNRLDPRTGQVYPLPLDGVRVLALYVDPQGWVWAGTTRGLYQIDPTTCAVSSVWTEPTDGGAPAAVPTAVYALAHDGAGGLWLGLERGVTRFDMATRQATPPADHILSRLPAERVWFIRPVEGGVLWLGQNAGVTRFNPLTGQVEPLAITDAQSGQPVSGWLRTARNCTTDAQGRVWIGTEDQGVVSLEPTTGRAWRFVHQPADPSGLSHNAIRALCRDQAGGLWFGTPAGLDRYDPQAPVFTPYRHEVGNPDSLGYDAVSTCFEDHQGRLWVGTDGGGLDCLDGSTFTHFTTQSAPAYRLEGNRIWWITEDHRGNLWFAGGAGGLGRRDPRTGNLRFYRPRPGFPRSFSSEVVYALLVDREGTLWIGTEQSGLARYEPATDDFTHFRHDPNRPGTLPSNTVSRLAEDGQGQLWVGTPHGVARLDRRTGAARVFVPDPDRPGSLGNGNVVRLFRDSAGGIWVGTHFGIYHFEPGTQTFRAFRSGAGQGFVGRIINDVVESPPGVLWVGTEDGLNRIESATGRVTAMTMRDGLPASRIVELYADTTGKLWLGLNIGLCQFDPVTHRFRLFDVRDGLVDNQARQSFFQRRNGEVLFVSTKGFTAFRPEAVRANPVPPPVVVTGFRKFDRLQPFDGESVLSLDYDENHFAFEFAALNYTVPERNQYAYRLEGFDRDWIYCGTRRYASYTNLDPGEYVFRVRGSNDSGLWNEDGKRVRVRIRPAPWRTWWAYLGYGLLLAGGVWFGLRVRLARVRAQARLREAQFRAQAAESQASAAAALATVRERDAEIFRLRNIELAEANQLVTDSLLYAQRIQSAILPDPGLLRSAFEETFVLYCPKDIVSGDFYWFHRTDDAWFLAVGDCTGHGVPGALMAMVGTTLLNQMVVERGLVSPAAILAELDGAVRRLLRQDQDANQTGAADGMDIILCRFDRTHGGLTLAGARRPLYVVTAEGVLTEYRGSRRAIGGRPGRHGLSFEETHLVVERPVNVYLTTDGLADQPDAGHRKFGTARLRTWLQQVAALPLALQGEQLTAVLTAHMGAEPQRDDITLVGVRYPGASRSF
jgi:ligand-binding sensor domain-containing protein/serine phosphatase RsbU (regulator of sigma subunit)